MATRAKAKISCPRVENTLGLLANRSKEHVSTATSLDTFDGIAHRGIDPKVMGHLSPNRRWDELGLPVRQDRGYASTTSSRTYEEGLPSEAGIPGFGDSAVPINCGIGEDTVCFSTP